RNAGESGGCTVMAGSARIEVAPGTDVEGKGAERHAATAVNVNFSRRTVRERDALEGRADIELDVLRDVVARLEIGGHRGLVVGLGDAAEDVVVHDRAWEGGSLGCEGWRRRFLEDLKRYNLSRMRTRYHSQRR